MENVHIGATGDPEKNTFDHVIDEVTIFDGTFSPATIRPRIY